MRRAAVQQARTERPNVFDEAEWPTLIASELVAPAHVPIEAPQSPTPTQGVESKPGYHYEKSPASGNYVPVRDGTSWRRSVGGG